MTWTYTWIAHGNPTTTIESRAVDDSGNIEKPSDAGTRSTSIARARSGATDVTPTTTDSGDPASVEVGVKFTTDTYGTITGIRFYKASDQHRHPHRQPVDGSSGQLLATRHLHQRDGLRLAAGQLLDSRCRSLPEHHLRRVLLRPQRPLLADDDYYLYTVPQPATMGATVANSPPLHALRRTATNGGNGVYTYSSSSTFPDNADTGTNYWVDVFFTPQPAPGPASNVTATAGYASATCAWSAPTTGGPATTYTITPYIGWSRSRPRRSPASPAPTTATVTGLTNGTSYTFTVTASNPAGIGRGVGAVQRGHPEHHGTTGLRPTGRHPGPVGQEHLGQAVASADRRQPPRGRGGGIEQLALERHRRHRHGGGHLHRALLHHRARWHRRHRLDRRGHLQRRYPADDHGDGRAPRPTWGSPRSSTPACRRRTATPSSTRR